jgi:hypothetical protein
VPPLCLLPPISIVLELSRYRCLRAQGRAIYLRKGLILVPAAAVNVDDRGPGNTNSRPTGIKLASTIASHDLIGGSLTASS